MPRRPHHRPLLALALAAGLGATGLAGTATTAVATGASAAPVRCDGLVATLVGTPGDDTLVGTPGRDVIVGLAGRDRIRGRGGDDVLCGNLGFDRLDGGRGDDRLLGGRNGLAQIPDGDFDTFVGDRLVGGPGDDHLDGGTDPRSSLGAVTGGLRSYDVLDFSRTRDGVEVDLRAGTARGQGTDTIAPQILQVLGSRGDDTVRAGRFALRAVTGAGDDTIIGSPRSDTLEPDGRSTGLPSVIRDADIGRGGDDVVRAGRGGDRVVAEKGRDTLHGGRGADDLAVYAGSGAPQVHGDAGRDRIYVDLLVVTSRTRLSLGRGGREDLILSVKDSPDLVWDLGTGSFVLAGEDVGAVVGGAERISLGSDFQHDRTQRATVVGSDRPELLYSDGAGPLTFLGRGGRDVLEGSRFHDTFDGGPGTDTFRRDGSRDPRNTCVSVERDRGGFCTS